MHCEQALNLISADLDHEAQPADRAWLDEHLRDCAGCSATAEAFRLQDLDLRRTFAGRREAAAAVAERAMERIALLEVAGPQPVLPLNDDLRLRRIRRLMGCVMAAAATIAGVALSLHAVGDRPEQAVAMVEPSVDTAPATPPSAQTANPPVKGNKAESDQIATGLLAALAIPTGPAVRTLAVGDTVQTEAGERLRVGLADGSLLYLNENTVARLDAERQVTLTRGEVFAEVAARKQADQDRAFLVKTADREVKALGTKFAVQAKAAATNVVVTQGRVQVSGHDRPVSAGEQLRAESKEAAPAPRASYLLDWTRDLVAAAEPPLVPVSPYRNGALLAKDDSGQQMRLALRDYKVDVHIEDGFARTTIDQTYFNHDPARREGTFYFPLPADASLSRLAMYVDGRLMEGGMAERDHARNTFETIVRRQKDPALLEWVDGSTFKMRVFPLEPRQEKRIILGYTQKLTSLYGRMQYRFPSGHSLERVGAWSFHAHVKGGADLDWSSDSHTLQATKRGGDLDLDAHADNVKIERDVTLQFQERDSNNQGRDVSHFASADFDGKRYFAVRYRPDLPSRAERQRRDWVFLFESSGDRDPLLARVQVEVIRTLLSNAEHDDTFVLLTAGTRVRPFDLKARPVTEENVQAAVRFLEQGHLIGALDLGQALDAVLPYVKPEGNPCLVHVGSGIPALGERREDVLARRIPNYAHYVGVGVGKRWARGFMKAAAERSDGYLTQINPDEPVAWRAFDLFATLNTPRLLNVQVVDNAEQARFLTVAGSLAQGEELCAIAQLDGAARLPEAVTVSGTLHGQPYHQVLKVESASPNAGYLPRTWAKLEIDRLLAKDAEGNRQAIVDLSKSMYVMTPFTSLLVLENPGMYKQFGVDPGRKDHWALYPCPEHLPPAPHDGHDKELAAGTGGREPAAAFKRREPLYVLQTIVSREPPRFVQWPNQPPTEYAGLAVDAPALPSEEFRLGFNRYDAYAKAQPFGTASGVSNGSYSLPGLPGLASKPELADMYRGRGSPSPGTPRQFSPLTGSVNGTKSSARGLRDGDGAAQLRLQTADSPAKKPTAPPMTAAGGMPAPPAPRSTNAPAVPPPAAAPAPPLPPITAPPALAGGVTKATEATPAEAFGGRNLTRAEPLLEAEGLRTETKGVDRLIGALRKVEVEEPSAAEMALLAEKRKELEDRVFEGAFDDERLSRDGKETAHPSRLYRRPVLNLDAQLFVDLLAFAPGIQNSDADIRSVLDSEAALERASSTGTVDPAARHLIDRARSTGWQEVIVPDLTGKPAFSLRCDGSGRHSWERVLGTGLREQVFCDGKTVLHLYPDLGVGAERTVSRFHRAEFAEFVPWVVPPAEDLAHGADVRYVAERVVAVAPRGVATAKDTEGKPLPYALTELVFATDGSLAERRTVRMPGEKALSRETYAADGLIRRLGADGRLLSEQRLPRRSAEAPNLSPDAGNFVVLPLPLRSREHVHEAFRADLRKGFQNLRPDTREALLATAYALHNSGDALHLVHSAKASGKRPVGYYTVLAACGVNVGDPRGGVDVLADYPNEPLARYLAFSTNPQRREGASELGPIGGPREGFVQRLAAFHDLSRRWQGGIPGQGEVQHRQERAAVLDFIRHNTGSPLGWALLNETLDHLTADEEFRRAVTDLCRRAEPNSALAYAACYEHARNLLNQGHRAEARELFQTLYARELSAGLLPPIDGSFREALQHDGTRPSAWSDFVRQTAATLLEKSQRPAVIGLAWQCRELGDQSLADDLVARACAEMAEEERLPAGLAGVEYWWHTGQAARAEALLQTLLNDPRAAQDASLWRLAATVVAQRGQDTLSASYLEKALDREYAQAASGTSLEAVRRDYATLLSHYRLLAQATVALKQPPPPDFADRVLRAADRWRALDPDPTAACQAAARVLKTLGLHEQAWDYLTTPVGLHPGEAAAWLELAKTLKREGDLDLTDRAYAQAAEAEPANAQILWDRALNLQQTGKTEEARELYRKLADGAWQPQFAALQAQARRYLNGR